MDAESAYRRASSYTEQHNTEKRLTHIHASSMIRTHDPSPRPYVPYTAR